MAGDDGGNDRSGRGGGSEEPEERTDGWMATYADMVTLLMTFFVLMFAISNVDQEKVMLMFAGLSRDGLSAQQFMQITEIFSPGGDPDGEWPLWDDPEEEPEPPDETDPGDLGNPALDELYERISQFIAATGLGDYMSLLYNGEFLMMTLTNDIWFTPGSAQVTTQMRDHVVMVASLLADTWDYEKPFEIVVAGHTDNTPINTMRYPNNWFLSVDRAANCSAILMDESGLDPKYFSLRGYGEERPIATNDTAEGRQTNRRVEILFSMLRDHESIPR